MTKVRAWCSTRSTRSRTRPGRRSSSEPSSVLAVIWPAIPCASGFLMFSTIRQNPSQGFSLPRFVDQSDPLERRLGGWFVTGSTGSAKHMGNEAAALDGRSTRELMSVDGLFDADGYRTLSSDIVAHMVFTHQVSMTNLLTRAGWQARADPALHPPYTAAPGEEERIALMMKGVASEVVDHLLFVDEAPLADRVRGQSGFAERRPMAREIAAAGRCTSST